VWTVQPDVNGGKLALSAAARTEREDRKSTGPSPSAGASVERATPRWDHRSTGVKATETSAMMVY
jgi:hypothetical protein